MRKSSGNRKYLPLIALFRRRMQFVDELMLSGNNRNEAARKSSFSSEIVVIKSAPEMKKSLLGVIFCIAGLSCKPRQDSAVALDQHLVLENEKVKVIEFDSSPGGDVCGEGMHSHPAHLNVLLTEARVKVMLPDGKTLTQNLPAGATFWSAAETHKVSNLGDKPIRAYMIVSKEK